jgi:NAD-dependent SIR2 family protein deacetylase
VNGHSAAIETLAALMRGRRTLVLSGAGISTESGIPDYRSPHGSLRARQPIQYREFVARTEARARYWARSAAGWPRVAAARPNAGHAALAEMEHSRALIGVITQNVDGLHAAAGSRIVIELHGALADVVCLGCGAREKRELLQQRILALNPGWADGPFRAASSEPDGDARLEPPLDGSFRVPGCLHCGGVLKPDVTFFGENVPRARVQEAFDLLARADVLLVLGSSLAVYSGYRFVAQAVQAGTPIAIVNKGPTRADTLAAVRIDAVLGEVLPGLAEALSPS